jgi:spore germination cell wall hydrolase CwlJ-like protein
MLTSLTRDLVRETRIWPTLWRRRWLDARQLPRLWRRQLAWYWQHDAKESLPFIAILALPVVGVIAIVSFAYSKAPVIEPERIHAMQREAARAQRRESDLECLAQNVYFEARGEPVEGQYAVAEVTLNRTRAEHFPHTVCGVVHEMRWDPGRRRPVADFSWTELGGLSPQDGPAWKRAMAVANAAYDDLHDPVVPGALFYHATSIKPGWAKTKKAIATIGNHVFYR